MRRRLVSTTSRSALLWRRSISSGSEKAAIEQEAVADRAWSQSPEAKAILTGVFERAKSTPPAGDADANMSSYLSRRAPTSHQPLCPSALRTLSATLTFPLTLSYGLRRIFASREVKMETIRVLCLGARAESSLPSVWWAECRRGADDVLEGQLSISFLGPHLQTHRPPRPLPPGTPLTLQHIDQGRSLFHLHPNHMRLLLHTDLFVLFNPGFGATEQLQQQWAPTLQLLLQTRKPVLASAHSARDLARDLAYLEALTNREDEQDLGEPLERIFSPHANPFASRRRTHDAREEAAAAVATTNEFVYAFQSK